MVNLDLFVILFVRRFEMQFFENVKIPVFGSAMPTSATWVDPVEPPTAGYYFTDEDWLKSTNAVRTKGVVEGISRSVDYNTVLRQCSTMASLFANILAYRNSEKRGGVGGNYPYKNVDSPIGTNFNGELDFNAHIGALSEIFSSDKFLFDSEIKTRNIADLSVTTSKLENSSGISNGVITEKIATDAVTKSKLGGDLVNTGLSEQNGIKVTLSQSAASGNRGLQIGVQSTKVTNAANADNSTNASNLHTNASSGTIFIAGPSSSVDDTFKPFYNSANVFITNGDTLNASGFNVTSDERLKEHIEEVGHNQVKALVENVTVKTFNYKKSPKKTYVGIVAQDILKANTVLGDSLVEKDGKDFLSVQESKLVYVLWDYVKQLKAEVTALEKRVKELEDK